MGSPIKAADLPPDLRARYGMDRGIGWGLLLGVALAVAFVSALSFVAFNLFAVRVQPQLLAWDVVAPDHTSVTFEVRRPIGADTYCVVRAQDERHIDVGYAVVVLPGGGDYAQTTYQLHTLAPSYVVEVLGCAQGSAPDSVIPPQFPPGVVPPPQPWQPEVTISG